MKLLVLALLILYDSMLIFQLEHVKALDTMAPYVWESGDFRAMRLGRDAAGRPFLDYEELAMAMLTENFDLTGKKLSGDPLFFPVRRQKEFERLSDAYRMVFADLSCFPVPESAGGDIRDVVYENGWMEERSFDGPRTHEGCDLMAGAPEAGLYPVVSMTDGVVEQAGWLKRAAGASGSGLRLAHICTTPTWTPMERPWTAGSGGRGIQSMPESFWAIWGIPATESLGPPASFQSTSTWGSTSGRSIMTSFL